MSSNLINSTPFVVTYLDGRVETLALARLSIRQLYAFAQLLSDDKTTELVSLCTGRDAGWIDSLADASYAELARRSIQENFQRASEVAKGDPLLALKLTPYARSLQILKVMAAAMAGPASSDSSPAPAPSVSAAATGSESSISPQADSSPSSSPSTA